MPYRESLAILASVCSIRNGVNEIDRHPSELNMSIAMIIVILLQTLFMAY